MKLISLDLEYNQPSKKIIQVGAVCFNSKTGEILDNIRIYVNPNEQLSDYIINLTGITQIDADLGVDVATAANMITNFKAKHSANGNGVVWGAGFANDVAMLYQQAGVDSPFKNTIIDVKSTHKILGGATSLNTSSLRECIEGQGLFWNTYFGDPHDALADAYNTALLYLHIGKLLKVGYNSYKEFTKE